MTWKVSGSTNLPLGDRERECDQEATRDRIFRRAGWEDHPSPAKTKRAFFAYDNDSPMNLSSYKRPFADVVGGELKAIPRAARNGVGVPEEVLWRARALFAAHSPTGIAR